MAAIKVHLSVVRKGPFGGSVTKSLCGRNRTLSDGMNLSASPAAVTCAFCKKQMQYLAGQIGSTIESKGAA